MNGFMILVLALVYFAIGYKFYGGFIARFFKVDDNLPTPAVENNDGVDYVPTHPAVLFGHHFASIAGAGPIIGPIIACKFGWIPALIWILVGCVFVGAVHDFAALFLSVRNKGKSIGYVIEGLMSIWGRQMFLFFCWACLILVVAVFGLLVANTFAMSPSVATASIIFILMAPVFGFLTSRGVSLKIASCIFVPLVFATVYIAAVYPLNIAEIFNLSEEQVKNVWLIFLAVYALVASVTPVQWLLQPRDYLSSYLLYVMIALGIVGIMVYNPEIKMTGYKGLVVTDAVGNSSYLFPELFILIACGACSGFHSLVSSGTTSKQIRSEKDMQTVGYGAMIVEGILGVMSLIAVIYLTDDSFAEVGKNQVMAFSKGISAFVGELGLPQHIVEVFISLSISAFMLTSLDTATRLGRFVWQELFSPSYSYTSGTGISVINHREYSAKTVKIIGIIRKIVANPVVASLLVVCLAGFLVATGSANTIWPVFGASNQLLASLTLLAITLYLMQKGCGIMVTFIPTVLMMIMSIWGLVQLVNKFIISNMVITVTSIFLIVMAVLMVILSFIVMYRNMKIRRFG